MKERIIRVITNALLAMCAIYGYFFIPVLFTIAVLRIEAFALKHKDDLTGKNIKYFIQGYGRLLLRELGLLSKKRAAIIDKRIQQVKDKSPYCLSQGQCVNCGCKTFPMAYSDKQCEGNCFN